jgi:hypothetical protein
MMAKKWKEKVVSFLFLRFGDGQRKKKKSCKKKIVGFNNGQKKRKRDCIFFFMSFGHGRFGVCKKILMILLRVTRRPIVTWLLVVVLFKWQISWRSSIKGSRY